MYVSPGASTRTAVGTAALLPVEVHEILARFTIPRLLALLINIAAVVYLLLASVLTILTM